MWNSDEVIAQQKGTYACYSMCPTVACLPHGIWNTTVDFSCVLCDVYSNMVAGSMNNIYTVAKVDAGPSVEYGILHSIITI